MSNGYQGTFPWGKSGRVVKLTTLFHLMPRLRMSAAIPPLPHYVFIKPRFMYCIQMCRNINFVFLYYANVYLNFL